MHRWLLAALLLAAMALPAQVATASPVKSGQNRHRKCSRRAGHDGRSRNHRRCVARRHRSPSPATDPAADSTASPEGPAATTDPIAAKGPQEPESPTETTEPPGTEPAPEQPFRFFSPTSIWNMPVPTDAALDPESGPIMAGFDALVEAEQAEERGPSINTSKWSIPVYEVPADQPTVRVALDEPKKSPALQVAWEQVPLPPDANPAAGTDKHLVVWQPSSDHLWEFWRLEPGEAGWHASWGGAMEHASQSPGYYDKSAWAGAQERWGASASSLSIAGGLITFEDLRRGRIEHALAMAMPVVRAKVYSLPAHRTDGHSDDPLALPEGAHLRLDPSLDLSSLDLPPLTRMIAEAAQHYGIFLRSRAAVVDLYGQDPTSLATNPYTGALGYFEGQPPYRLLAGFPWSHLQLLKMDLYSQG
jgi:hypothetical protein